MSATLFIEDLLCLSHAAFSGVEVVQPFASIK
jgi:hypothetical protein